MLRIKAKISYFFSLMFSKNKVFHFWKVVIIVIITGAARSFPSNIVLGNRRVSYIILDTITII